MIEAFYIFKLGSNSIEVTDYRWCMKRVPLLEILLAEQHTIRMLKINIPQVMYMEGGQSIIINGGDCLRDIARRS